MSIAEHRVSNPAFDTAAGAAAAVLAAVLTCPGRSHRPPGRGGVADVVGTETTGDALRDAAAAALRN